MTSEYFTYDKNKVIHALRYHFITRKEIKTMIVLVNVFAIISAILFYAHKVSPLAFLCSSVLWFSLMLTFWFFLPTSIYKKAKIFKERLRVVLNEDNFGVENEYGVKYWSWKEFIYTMENPNFFYVYFNTRSFLIIPKDAFLEEESAARRMFRTKISTKY